MKTLSDKNNQRLAIRVREAELLADQASRVVVVLGVLYLVTAVFYAVYVMVAP